jgi:phage shock protein C
MQRVITVSLNRQSVQLEEDAHLRLQRYLDEAGRRLAASPDRAEVLADLEQAVADQCARRLQPGQTVITLAELEPALAEIGEVELPGSGAAPRDAAGSSGAALMQVSDGAWISGVCRGLASASGLDTTLVRVIALVLLFATGGAMILLYLVLMLLLPFAPRASDAPPLRALPAKCREVVTLIRGKLETMTR